MAQFRVQQNYGKWRAGDVISGGDLSEYCGQERTMETDRIKLGMPEPPKGISADRIEELIKRGVLRDLDGSNFQPDAPIILQPSYEQRLQPLKAFNKNKFLT